MVILHTEVAAGEAIFTLRPNCSLSWDRMKAAFSVLAVSVICVALYFASLGAWLVLPFAGLEILLLWLGIYASARRGATREVIHIAEDAVAVYRGRRRLEEVCRFTRPWARVKLVQDGASWYPARLLIMSHGRSVEVGSALTDDERSELAGQLLKRISFQPEFKPLPAIGRLNELDPARQQI
jgi:uncharacterized membrane protein